MGPPRDHDRPHGGGGGHRHGPAHGHGPPHGRPLVPPYHHGPHHHGPPHRRPHRPPMGGWLWCCHRRGPPPFYLCCCTYLGITTCCCPPAGPLPGESYDDDPSNPIVVAPAEVIGAEGGEGEALIRRPPRSLQCNEYDEGAPSKRYRLELPSDAHAGEVLQIELDGRMFTVTVPESFIPGEGVVVIAPAP